jgi:hypothetical protein
MMLPRMLHCYEAFRTEPRTLHAVCSCFNGTFGTWSGSGYVGGRQSQSPQPFVQQTPRLELTRLPGIMADWWIFQHSFPCFPVYSTPSSPDFSPAHFGRPLSNHIEREPCSTRYAAGENRAMISSSVVSAICPTTARANLPPNG